MALEALQGEKTIHEITTKYCNIFGRRRSQGSMYLAQILLPRGCQCWPRHRATLPGKTPRGKFIDSRIAFVQRHRPGALEFDPASMLPNPYPSQALDVDFTCPCRWRLFV